MIHYSLKQIAEALNLTTPTIDTTFTGISQDTRKIVKDNLYVAIEGQQFDGNQFIEQAFKNGAAAALVCKPANINKPQLVVENTVTVLGKISEHWRDSFSLPLVAVTGSNGKTTLKNMIASILRAACNNDEEVLATEGNLNNHIGMPLMLARLNKNHRYAVIEMGMNHFGEIQYLSQLAKPTVAIINNAAESHLEEVKTVAGVAKAKGEIFSGLHLNGTAILNKDDAQFSYWQSLIKNTQSILTFGLKNSSDITAQIDNNKIKIMTPNGNVDVMLPLLGEHNIMNALAATAAALAVNINLSFIKKGLENIKPAPGRMQQYLLTSGTRIIDDTYNANPFSLQAAVKTLSHFKGTKILVLGDMKELGEDTAKKHWSAGEKIREAGIDYLFTFGELSKNTSQAFGNNSQHFTDKQKLITALQAHLQKDVTVLIKGSRSMKMEQVLPREILCQS